MIKNLASQTSWYFIVHVFATIVGLITFPIWTRYFTVEEYGMIVFINSVLFFIGPVAKAGLHRAVVRFFSEFSSGKRSLPMSSYYTTFPIGAFVFSAFIGIIFLSIILILGPELMGEQMYDIFKITSVLVILGPIPAIFLSTLRAEQKVKFFAAFKFSEICIGFVLSLVLVFVFSAGVKGIFLAAALTQIFWVSIIFLILKKQKKLIFSAFSLGLLVEGFRFGLPLIPAELGNQLSSIGDRYVLQFFLGSQAVGLYAVGYGLTNRLKALATVMMIAVTPIYLDIWGKSGREKTEEFLSSVLDYYLMVAIPGIILFSVFGGDMMILLASSKYEAARVIVPFLAAPLLLHGAITIYTAGLYIHKKTKLIMLVTLCSGILNFILNIIFVPLMGILGAAIATLISYLVLIFLANFLSAKYLTIHLNYSGLIKYIAASVMAVILLHFINFEIFFGVLIKLAIGVLIYSATILLIDSRIREKIRMAFKF